ncbi:MAG: acetyl-CoA carboxylase biotin carboxylase subunit, partial [Myxococcales bacterium]|nr:acetyl-CoA carboxylase biotin carboxylase subunit [Myxococcales bacterium]
RQVLGDGQGQAIWLGTRDCSLQRRHQKIVEEGPAINLSATLLHDIQEAAARLMRTVRYQTVATVEFLVQDDGFWFLEVNPRIQVEHPVTEAVTGLDLVALQLALAAGEPLPIGIRDVTSQGHAIEVRINAEDPWSFVPSPGRVTAWHAPGGHGVRVDTAVHEQAFVPPYYDSLVAKVIVHGRDRRTALAKMRRALDELVVEGIHTTAPLQRALLDDTAFREATFHTRFVDQWLVARGER